MANGRLTDANERSGDRELVARLRAIAGDLPLDRLAVAFVAARPFVDVVLSGAATTAQLASHVAAMKIRLDRSTPDALAGLAEPPERYWPTRGSLGWA